MVSGGTETTTVEQLQQNLHAVNNEITHLQAQGLKVEELQLHIDKLHEYNELKDLGQLVIGRLANLRGITTRDLYTEYGLKLED